MKFSEFIVKHKKLILTIALVLMIPSRIGYIGTRVNYDMLTYLPRDMDTTKGQNELMNEFSKGAYAIIVAEDMPATDVAKLQKELEQIDHVTTVIGYGSLANGNIPKELLPDSLTDKFANERATMIALFMDTTTSSDESMETLAKIRQTCGKQCFVSSLTAMVSDLRDLCEQEEPIYVGLAVLLSVIAMTALLDSYLAPVVFLISIGMMIIMNLGSNIFMGEISYITKALAAVLQLAVTMDYSIFLWNSYNEQIKKESDHNKAMANAIDETITSVIGSSVTTIAGFIALCFMSFTLGKDLGIVMAKGVLLGVLGCVTVLPSLILLLDKPLQKSKHRQLMVKPESLAQLTTKRYLVFLVLFVLSLYPAYYSYSKAKTEVYYNLSATMPQDMDFRVANSKLEEDFGIATSHILIMRRDLPSEEKYRMEEEIKKVSGVSYIIAADDLTKRSIPDELIPQKIRGEIKGDKWEIALINSEYAVATDEVNAQIDEINSIIKKYDSESMLIGEAPCMKDMIEVTDKDFATVNIVSIALVFIIIAFVEKSRVLPFILIAVIELATFINLGIPHWTGRSMPFIAPVCVSTIQLGATVDYAILTTTRYKNERLDLKDKKTAVRDAMTYAIPSVIVSGCGLFMATFGVAVYSDIDIIKSICMLIARGAMISMVCVIFILPALLIVFDTLICRTTFGMKKVIRQKV